MKPAPSCQLCFYKPLGNCHPSRRVSTPPVETPTFGRAASGGALAPEPPRATRSQPEPIRTVPQKPLFFTFFGVEPSQEAAGRIERHSRNGYWIMKTHAYADIQKTRPVQWTGVQAKPKFRKFELSRLNRDPNLEIRGFLNFGAILGGRLTTFS